MTGHDNPTGRPRLPILEDAAEKHAPGGGPGFDAPRPIPPGVQVSEGDVLYREWVPGPAGPRGWVFGATLSFAAMVGSASLAARGGWLAVPTWIVAIVAGALLLTAINFRGLLIVVDRREAVS